MLNATSKWYELGAYFCYCSDWMLCKRSAQARKIYIFSRLLKRVSSCVRVYSRVKTINRNLPKKTMSRFQSPNKYFKCFQIQMGKKHALTAHPTLSRSLSLSYSHSHSVILCQISLFENGTRGRPNETNQKKNKKQSTMRGSEKRNHVLR